MKEQYPNITIKQVNRIEKESRKKKLEQSINSNTQLQFINMRRKIRKMRKKLYEKIPQYNN